MIDIQNKNKCCGCSACKSACPKHCITFYVDKEGFQYPQVDKYTCIKCDICEKVCPYVMDVGNKKPTGVYAAKYYDSVRQQSSSGGIFTALAKSIIKQKGVVVGAAFDDEWTVKHIIIENETELLRLQGSKYVQSYLGDIFPRAKKILDTGQLVLFSGTPCQVHGLKNYLRKDYNNLLCVEVICHGVPSPLIWKTYLSSIIPPDKNLININFRDKRRGWLNYGLTLCFADGSESYQSRERNLYLKGYLSNTFLRPSCYNCPSKDGKSGADISLGDYWGVNHYHNEIYDNKGVSLVMVYTEKGKEVFGTLDVDSVESSYDSIFTSNGMIAYSTPIPDDRDLFWTEFQFSGLKALNNVIQRRKPKFSISLRNTIRILVRTFIRKEK